MVSRRTTLLGLAGASLTAVARSEDPGITPTATSPGRASPGTAGGDQAAMQADLARLGVHEYSDEGIPVFLACEDLAAGAGSRPAAHATDLGRRVAADLRRYAVAWQRRHPDAPESDAPKIIELLAERDFLAGGKP